MARERVASRLPSLESVRARSTASAVVARGNEAFRPKVRAARGETAPFGVVREIPIDYTRALAQLKQRAETFSLVSPEGEVAIPTRIITGPELSESGLEQHHFIAEITEALRWGQEGTGTGSIHVTQAEPLSPADRVELFPLFARDQNEAAGISTPEIPAAGFFATMEAGLDEVIPEGQEGRVAVWGPSATFTGTTPDDKKGGAEVGTLRIALVREDGSRVWRNADIQSVGDAETQQGRVSYPSITAEDGQKDHYSSAILENVTMTRENPDGEISTTGFPAVILFDLPAGQTLTTADITRLASGNGQIKAGGTMVMFRSDGTPTETGNTVYTLPDKLEGETTADVVKNFGESDSLIAVPHQLDAGQTVAYGGSFREGSVYAGVQSGHYHQVLGDPESPFINGHLVNIKADAEHPVTVAIVVYPAEWQLVNPIAETYAAATQTQIPSTAEITSKYYRSEVERMYAQMEISDGERQNLEKATDGNPQVLYRLLSVKDTPDEVSTISAVVSEQVADAKIQLEQALASLPQTEGVLRFRTKEAIHFYERYGMALSNMELAMRMMQAETNGGDIPTEQPQGAGMDNVGRNTPLTALELWQRSRGAMIGAVSSLRTITTGSSTEGIYQPAADFFGNLGNVLHLEGLSHFGMEIYSSGEDQIVSDYRKSHSNGTPFEFSVRTPAFLTAEPIDHVIIHDDEGYTLTDLARFVGGRFRDAFYNFTPVYYTGKFIRWLRNR